MGSCHEYCVWWCLTKKVLFNDQKRWRVHQVRSVVDWDIINKIPLACTWKFLNPCILFPHIALYPSHITTFCVDYFNPKYFFGKSGGSLMCYCSYHNINACLLLVHNDLILHVNVCTPFVNSIETLKYLRVMELNLLLKTFLMLHVSRLVVKWLWLGEHTNTLWIAIRGLILLDYWIP